MSAASEFHSLMSAAYGSDYKDTCHPVQLGQLKDAFYAGWAAAFAATLSSARDDEKVALKKIGEIRAEIEAYRDEKLKFLERYKHN